MRVLWISILFAFVLSLNFVSSSYNICTSRSATWSDTPSSSLLQIQNNETININSSNATVFRVIRYIYANLSVNYTNSLIDFSFSTGGVSSEARICLSQGSDSSGSILFIDTIYDNISSETNEFSSKLNQLKQDCTCFNCTKDLLLDICAIPVLFYYGDPNVSLSYNTSLTLYQSLVINQDGGSYYVVGSVKIIPLNEWFDQVAGGNSLKEVLESWNPVYYEILGKAFKNTFTSKNLKFFPNNFISLFVAFLNYIFREPASLSGGDFYA